MAKGFKVWDNDYDIEINPTNFPEGKEMPGNYTTGKKVNSKLVWRPVSIGTNPSFDSDIQTRSAAYVINDSDVTINYTVNDKDLAAVKASKKTEAKGIGKNIVFNKHTPEDQMNANAERLTQGEIDQQNTDIGTIRSYYKNDLVPSINACTTVQQVKAITINFPDIS